ncbi:hypothetical protein BYT27DRAFT_7250694 [Phlegmacium glaucopus]|nr:hypothetical protein BYT27DRAFT_7250694 [Phlegmacium glaucopus]
MTVSDKLRRWFTWNVSKCETVNSPSPVSLTRNWKADELASMDLAAGSLFVQFDRIPIELWQEFFLRCLSPSPLATAGLLLWRQASVDKARPSVLLATTWLARSEALPSSLSLYQQNESDDNRIAAGQILELYKRAKILPLVNLAATVNSDAERIHHSNVVPISESFWNFRFCPASCKPACFPHSVSQSLGTLFRADTVVPIRFPFSELYSPCLRILAHSRKMFQLEGRLFLSRTYTYLWPSYHESGVSQTPFVDHQPIISDNLCQEATAISWMATIQLEAFLEHSQCRLAHFEVHDTSMNCDQRQDGLDMEPRAGLGEMGSSACFLPNLESLVIRGSILWAADGGIANV